MYDSPEVEAEHIYRKRSAETVLSCNKARYYNPSIGRFISEDKYRFEEGPSFFSYALNSPALQTDPTGYSIEICSRKTDWGVGNHAYIRIKGTNEVCARNSASGGGNPERPEPGNDQCNEVPGSQGKESEIMDCCRKNANNWGYSFGPSWLVPIITTSVGLGPIITPSPIMGDCQDFAKWCVEKNGAKWPGVPGGRIGQPCDRCPNSPPPPPRSCPSCTIQ